MAEYTITVNRIETTDPRLGRHVAHDSRSRMFPYRAIPRTALVSKKHERAIPVLDQGNLGSCTGNAAVGAVGTAPDYVPWKATFPKAKLDETAAVAVYSLATQLDSYPGTYPPEDTGSDGLSVAKACKQKGWISGYQWAFSPDAAYTALQDYPIIVGSNWYGDMFEPLIDGRLLVSGELAGGHEYVVDEIDVENERVWMTNSWGGSWGVNGRAYMTFADFERLLDEQGDVCVLLPLDVPAPTPEPPTPTPEPVPPEPVPPTPDPVDVAFAGILKPWLAKKPWCYKSIQLAAKNWLIGKHL